MATFKQVAAQLRVVANNVTVNAAQLVRKVALAIDQSLVLATPVDTGRARSNWQVAVGAAPQGEVTTFTSPVVNKRTKAGEATLSAGVAANGAAATEFALTAALEATKNFQGGVIYITNNLPYIIPLNDGHSTQAPKGFVQTAILNGIAAVKTVSLIKPPEAQNNG